MAGSNSKMDRSNTAPFHIKVFYRLGSHFRPDEFSAGHHSSPSALPPQHFSLSTWPDCTLQELSYLVIDSLRSSAPLNFLPSPVVGTRLAFRLVFPDPAALRGGPGTPARFTTKDLGSVVVGGDGAGRLPASDDEDDNDDDEDNGDGERGGGGGAMDVDDSNGTSSRTQRRWRASSVDAPVGSLGGDPDKTLADARFVIGDYLSVAVLPPGRNGEIASMNALRGPPSAPAASVSVGPGRRFDADDRSTNGWHADSRGSSRRQGVGIGGALPAGDWRRGERLPPVEPRGYGRNRRGY